MTISLQLKGEQQGQTLTFCHHRSSGGGCQSAIGPGLTDDGFAVIETHDLAPGGPNESSAIRQVTSRRHLRNNVIPNVSNPATIMDWTSPTDSPDRPEAFVLLEFTVSGHNGNTFSKRYRNQRTVKRIVVMIGQAK